LACGIVGVVAKEGVLQKPLGRIIRESLKKLEYRGYDSVGFAILTRDGKLIVRKSRGMIDNVSAKLGFDSFDGLVGIGHTRWATHGKPSDVNAHPHVDCSGAIAVVHNGIIENYEEIRTKLSKRGHRFTSDTDTEVIPHLMEEFKKQGAAPYEAFKKTVARLKGAYALAVVDSSTPDRIFFARSTSPLVVGLGNGVNFLASDIPAFLEFTRKIIILRDGEVGYVTADNVVVERRLKKESDEVRWVSVNLSGRVRLVEWTAEMAMKGGYPHFMLKEIHEQPNALASTLAGIEDQVIDVVNALSKAESVVIVGAGTSFHASYLGSLLMSNLARKRSVAIISSEAKWHLRSIGEGDVVIAVSQSGETIDTLLAVREARAAGALTIALSNVVDSAIPRESHMAIYTRAGPEIGVAATKTFTTQVAVLSYLAVKVAERTGTISSHEARRYVTELRKAPEIAAAIIAMHEAKARVVARRMAERTNAFYLGRGYSLPIAMEGALKLKEIAYVHAESYPAGESKHGPIALVEENFPVLFTAVGRDDGGMIRSNIEEMKARLAWTLAVAPQSLKEVLRAVDVAFKMPDLHEAVAVIVYVIPYQLIAYYTAVRKGYDPDKPRNLAKTVTVV